MLPELDVFYSYGHKLVCPEWVTLHNKDLLFVSPEDRGQVSVHIQ